MHAKPRAVALIKHPLAKQLAEFLATKTKTTASRTEPASLGAALLHLYKERCAVRRVCPLESPDTTRINAELEDATTKEVNKFVATQVKSVDALKMPVAVRFIQKVRDIGQAGKGPKECATKASPEKIGQAGKGPKECASGGGSTAGNRLGCP